MSEITVDSFKETLNVLIDANPHARNKGDEFKSWSKDNFGCDARISYIKEQRQITNRVSEQFRYFAPVVVFVCVTDVKRDTLIKYILERVYTQLQSVAIIGVTDDAGKKKYSFEYLISFGQSNFTAWATPHFDKVKTAEAIAEEMNIEITVSDAESGIAYAWYVGSTGNDENGKWTDFSDEYIEQGIWKNGWEDKFIDVVKSIKVGDLIALKASYTKKKGLPFNNHNKTVGVMGIKAIGTVTGNDGDGKKISVEWTRVDPLKEWFGAGVLRQTIHKVVASDGYIRKALLDFTFSDIAQDYSICEEQYMDEIEDATGCENQQEENKCEKDAVLLKTCLDVKLSPRKSDKHPLNFIIYGAPGTGKTYATAEYALAIIENREVDNQRKSFEERREIMEKYNDFVRGGQVVFTTFHQSYGYEEFIQGLRPNVNAGQMSFATVDGVFKRIADAALNDSNNNYVIIIDEINRANISKVFGELITLVENDKRWGELNQTCATLQSGDIFAVPNNLYIIGTMNSADKSISLIDAALRRRFEFFEQYPDTELIDNKTLKEIFKKLNSLLADTLESSDLLVGHSYFMGKNEDDLCDIFNHSIIPLLYEYFYDNKKKVISVLTEVLKDTDVTPKDNKISRVFVEKKAEQKVDEQA